MFQLLTRAHVLWPLLHRTRAGMRRLVAYCAGYTSNETLSLAALCRAGVETVLSHNSPPCLHSARVGLGWAWCPRVLHLGGGANVMHGTAPAQPSPVRTAAHIIQPGTDKVTINCYPAAVRGAASAYSLSSPSSWSLDTAGHRQPAGAGAAAEQLVINSLLLKKPRAADLLDKTTFNRVLAQIVIK